MVRPPDPATETDIAYNTQGTDRSPARRTVPSRTSRPRAGRLRGYLRICRPSVNPSLRKARRPTAALSSGGQMDEEKREAQMGESPVRPKHDRIG